MGCLCELCDANHVARNKERKVDCVFWKKKVNVLLYVKKSFTL